MQDYVTSLIAPFMCVCVCDGAAPDVPEPFATLEMIYEEMGDEDKRFQVSGQAFLVLLVSKHAVEFGRKGVGQRVGQGVGKGSV